MRAPDRLGRASRQLAEDQLLKPVQVMRCREPLDLLPLLVELCMPPPEVLLEAPVDWLVYHRALLAYCPKAAALRTTEVASQM